MQILQFLRTDRKATAKGDVSPRPCISFVVKDLCAILQQKGISITDKEFHKRIANFPLNMINPQWFLNETTSRTSTPSSRYLLNIHAKQKRCCQIYQSSFEDSVLERLDTGGSFHAKSTQKTDNPLRFLRNLVCR